MTVRSENDEGEYRKLHDEFVENKMKDVRFFSRR
jgi:hypothetical protein